MENRPKYVRSRSAIDDLPVRLPPIRSVSSIEYEAFRGPLPNDVLRSPGLGQGIETGYPRAESPRTDFNLDMLANAALTAHTAPPGPIAHRGSHIRTLSGDEYGHIPQVSPLELSSRSRAHSQPGGYHQLRPYEHYQAFHQQPGYQHYPPIDATFIGPASRYRRNMNRAGTNRAYSAVPWTARDDELLTQLKEEKLGWKEIARSFPGRTSHGCQFRWRRLHATTIKARNKKDDPGAVLSSDESDEGVTSPTEEVLSSELSQVRLRSPTIGSPPGESA